MSFRSTSRKGLAALGVLAPVLGGGYYAADPDNFNVATEAEAHAMAFAFSDHARSLPVSREAQPPRIPRGAARLFALPAKGPRADRYPALAQESKPAKGAMQLASLGGYNGDITGAIPRESAHRGTVDRSQKADRALPPPTKATATMQYKVESPPSSSLFLASLISPQSYNFPGMEGEKKDAREADKSEGPTKLPRGLAFQGETENEYQARQRRCLATAIYFEARGEPESGQLAVAQVVMNRVRSSIYPDTICGVVFQGQRQRKGCQFSFTCDGHADIPREKGQWLLSNRLAKKVLNKEVWLPEIGHATHYHATYVKPGWRRQMHHVKKVGRHIFYRVRYPQIDDVLKSDQNQETSLALRKSG